MVSVKDGYSGWSSNASVTVYVVSQPLEAIIRGGSRVVGSGTSVLVLDAGDSYDPNVEGLTGHAAGIGYEWSCVQLSDVYGRDCDNFAVPPPPNNSTWRISGPLRSGEQLGWGDSFCW